MKKYIYLNLLFFFYSLCSVFLKFAAKEEFFSTKFFFCYGVAIIILGLYAILWQQILKHFSLTTAFLNKAITIVWGMIWGFILFQEKINLTMIIGSLIVLGGLLLIGDNYE